jgi:hypothetical protein
VSASVLVVPGSLRDAVTSQIASLALAVTTAGITVMLASCLGLMPLYNEDIDTRIRPVRWARCRRCTRRGSRESIGESGRLR